MKVNKLSDFGYAFQIKLIALLFKDIFVDRLELLYCNHQLREASEQDAELEFVKCFAKKVPDSVISDITFLETSLIAWNPESWVISVIACSDIIVPPSP